MKKFSASTPSLKRNYESIKQDTSENGKSSKSKLRSLKRSDWTRRSKRKNSMRCGANEFLQAQLPQSPVTRRAVQKSVKRMALCCQMKTWMRQPPNSQISSMVFLAQNISRLANEVQVSTTPVTSSVDNVTDRQVRSEMITSLSDISVVATPNRVAVTFPNWSWKRSTETRSNGQSGLACS